MNLQAFLRSQWTRRGVWAWLWSPLSLLVCLVARLKRLLYQLGIRKQTRIPVPLIVIGNLSVGGAGKTPLVAYLADLLRKEGYRPGILSRGYKGSASQWPQNVVASSDPDQVGDEPVMLAQLTGCPVVAGPDRVASARKLTGAHQCNLIISDDGFQHLQLARDIDILVFDTQRGEGLGNGWCLPSGPLRESAATRKYADMQVMHGVTTGKVVPNSFSMSLKPGRMYALNNRKKKADYRTLQQQPLHAIAGIGRPERFFESLRTAGLTVIEHPFDDHHHYTAADLQFDDQYGLVTTEKDAIKLAAIETSKTVWVLPVQAILEQGFRVQLLTLLEKNKAKP